MVGAKGSLRRLPERVCDLCEQYGDVRSCECVRLGGHGKEEIVVCFVEMHLPCRQAALIEELGALPFGEGVCFRLALAKRPPAGRPETQATQHSNVYV